MSKSNVNKKKTVKAKVKVKTKKGKMKCFNVFYTPIPYEVEVLVKARTIDEAIGKVNDLLSASTSSIRGGWEVMSDKEYEEQYGIVRNSTQTRL